MANTINIDWMKNADLTGYDGSGINPYGMYSGGININQPKPSNQQAILKAEEELIKAQKEAILKANSNMPKQRHL